MKRNLLAICLAAALLATPVAVAGGRHGDPGPSKPLTLAVIGDIPYGEPQITNFPAELGEISADPQVRRVIHLGDIKNGSSRCDTSYFQARLDDFNSADDPFLYTPGDNEWTDCHRANNGGYEPPERLRTLRALFFDEPGRTLGRQRAKVEYQSHRYPENVLWTSAGVPFGLVHVVGSNDNQLRWFGDRRDASGELVPETPAETGLRVREYVAREAAALRWIDRIFDEAEDEGAPAVVIGMQADMWDGDAAIQTAYVPIKAVLADRAARFGKPVLLLQGDSHEFLINTVPGQPDNLTRIVVQGSTSEPHEWLRLRVDPSAPGVFSCERVVFAGGGVSPCPPRTPLVP
ncbi:MAG: metallophosphoesterase [Solirubrobacteraceae bacterium]